MSANNLALYRVGVESRMRGLRGPWLSSHQRHLQQYYPFLTPTQHECAVQIERLD
jgi:hypothetical protein